MKPETERWLRAADIDLQMASMALEAAFFDQCIFHSQQAIEKALKANWIERAESGLPRRTHSLQSLAHELHLGLTESQSALLDYLYEEYTSSRYPDEEALFEAAEVFARYYEIRSLYEWLRRLPS